MLYKGKKRKGGSMTSTNSKSSRNSNVLSSRFRKRIISLYGGTSAKCCVSGGDGPFEAAHIYAKGGHTSEMREAEFSVLNFRDNSGNIMSSLSDTSNGMLLRNDLHKAFDQYMWCVDMTVSFKYFSPYRERFMNALK